MDTSARHRAISAFASLAIVGGGMAALLAGFSTTMTPSERSAALSAVVILRPADPVPREVPNEVPAPAADGKSSPPNLRGKATAIAAPRALLPPLIVPPPIVTASRPASGSAAQTGAADYAGDGQGAGGMGDGSGGGGSGGEGYGDGAGDDIVSRPRQIRGRLHFSDLPPDLRKAKAGGDLKLQYRIGVDGRVSDCRILISSGRPSLDETTCRLIIERFRFKPARNRQGQPVASTMVETHGWLPPPEDDQ